MVSELRLVLFYLNIDFSSDVGVLQPRSVNFRLLLDEGRNSLPRGRGSVALAADALAVDCACWLCFPWTGCVVPVLSGGGGDCAGARLCWWRRDGRWWRRALDGLGRRPCRLGDLHDAWHRCVSPRLSLVCQRCCLKDSRARRAD